MARPRLSSGAYMALLSVILAHPRHGSFNHAIAATG